MNLPEEAPRLNPLPFIVIDIVLLLAAVFIVTEAPDPFAPAPLLAAVACAGLGAILACIPIVLTYTRRRDAELAARQNQLATLAQTAAAAANQFDRTAANLRDTADTAAKMHKHAEQLPARMQEKIAEFKTQLNEIAITENEALAQEIATLRASETERLDTTLAAIKKTAADLAALEAAAQQRASEVSKALAVQAVAFEAASQTHAEMEAAAQTRVSEISKTLAAQNTALEATAQKHAADLRDTLARHAAATADAAKTLDTSRAEAERALAASIAKNTADALARLDERFAALTRELDETMRKHEQRLRETDAAQAAKPAKGRAKTEDRGQKAEVRGQKAEDGGQKTEDRGQKAEDRGQKAEDSAQQPAAETIPPSEPAPASESAAEAENANLPIGSTAQNAATSTANQEIGAPNEFPPAPAPTPAPATEEPPPPPPPRKRSAPKPRAPKPDEPAPDTDAPPSSDEYSQSSPDDAGDFNSAMSADGITRLLVTAYIGIGNKLYIRGDGPGMSWDKGAPLQFVSIGKWRWETSDATAPIAFKLYKNDTAECTSIGSLKLDPGHQHEVSANF